MDVNDYAGRLNDRVVRSFFASKLAPTMVLRGALPVNPFLTALSFISRHLFSTRRALQRPGQRVDFRSIDS